MCNTENLETNPIKVSVVMPIYNAIDYLKPAMDSIIGQTLRDIEIICIDDGSTDRSIDVLREYQKTDSRIRLVTETNAGPSIARNNGIKRARGEFIAFVDADDFYAPTFLEKLYEIGVRDELDIVISKYDIYNSSRSKFEAALDGDDAGIYAEGVVTSKSEHPDVILSSTIGSAWNKLFRTSFVVDKQLAFPPDVRFYEDVYFVTTAMSLAERVGKCFDILVHHRIHSEQSRAKTFKKYYPRVPDVYKRIKEFLVAHGLYAPLSTSFLKLSATRCMKIMALLPSDARESFYNMLHGEYAEELGWHDREASEFSSREVCEFVASVQMYTYKEYKKRLSHGKSVDVERLPRQYKGRRFWNKLRRIFGGKKQ